MSTFDNESKSPYYSKDIEISTITSPKEYCGFMKRSINITFGNQDTMIIENKEDISDVYHKTMIEQLEEVWDSMTSFAKDKNIVFIDEIRHRNLYKDEILNGKKDEPKKKVTKETSE